MVECASLCGLIASFLLASYVGVGGVSESGDEHGLIAFKAGADVGGRFQSAWMQSTYYCQWAGVKECRNGRVRKLVVENAQLNGTFEANTLSKLDQLRVLSLKGNGLTGAIPDLSGLYNLKVLFLNDNIFTGPFPGSIAGLHRLRIVVLSDNFIAGEIPAALTKLPRLCFLSLENNRLSGEIPAFNRTELKFFNVSNNNFSGPVPETEVLSAFNFTSFIGNPALCGRIVRRACSSPQNQVFLPFRKSRTKLSGGKIYVIVAGSAVGLAAILCGVIISFVYKRRRQQQPRCLQTDKHSSEQDKAEGREHETSDGGRHSSKRRSPQSGSSGNQLVFCSEETQIFSLDDLLRAPAVILGRGSLGSSYKAVMQSGLTVTVKRLRNCNRISRSDLERHMQMVGDLRHPNIVCVKAYFHAREESLLVYDYYANGSLFSLIHGIRSSTSSEVKTKALHWTSCLKIAEDIGQGVAYLHTMSLIHGNLKSSNVVIGSEFEACITDYCLTLFSSDSDSDSSDSAYRSPECKVTRKMTFKADIYSFGVVLLEMLSGRIPTQSLLNNISELPRWVKAVRQEESEESGSGSGSGSEGSEDKLSVLMNTAMACVSPSPDLRPSIREVVRMIQEAREREAHVSSHSSDHSPARWSDTIHSLPRDRATDRSFSERD